MPLENFCILHQSGECVFLQNYHGAPLPLNTVLGLSSCISMVVGATSKGSTDKKDKEKDKDNFASDAASPSPSDSSASSNNAAAQPATCTITVNSYKFVYLDLAPYTLIAQGNTEESEQFLSTYIYDVRDLIQIYLGNGVVNSEDLSAIKGIVDLIHHLLQKYQTDLSYLVAGNRWVYLEEEVREQVDRLLSQLEENSIGSSSGVGGIDGTGGGAAPGVGASGASSVSAAAAASAAGTLLTPEITGSMLVLGNSILHSRMPNLTSRFLLQHLACRPLGLAKCRTLPLYFDGAWRYYAFIRFRTLTLVTSMNIKCALNRVLQLILEFEEDLVEANLNLPVEEPPVLLRHYSGYDTIAFLYHHHLTGVTVAPPPRNTHAVTGASSNATSSSAATAAAAAPTSVAGAANAIANAKAQEHQANQAELTKTLQVFNWFYSRANQLLTKAYVSEVILHLKGYRFYGVHESEFSLFILYSENVAVPSLASYNKEILENILRHNGALIAE